MIDAFTKAPVVQDWQWDLAARIRRGVEQTYGSLPDEVKCVEAIVQAINSMPSPSVGVTLSKRLSLTLEVEAAFLHGSKSQVRFQVGGTEYQRELADLLVLGAYVHDGRLAFQRACLIQAKRSGQSTGQAAARYVVDLGQLVLLASFPEFIGVAGVFKGLKVHLRNRSGMLGAYGLLSPPGEIIIVSARVLNQVLGGRRSLAAKELVPAILSESAASRSSMRSSDDCWWFDPNHCPSCHELAMHGFPHHWRRHHKLYGATGLGGVAQAPVESVLTCIGLDEFVQCWTGLRLGEVWHAGVALRSDRILRAALHAAVRRVGNATGKLAETVRVVEHAGGNDNIRIDNDNTMLDGGGFGIVSVIVRLRDGQV
ncbi:MAG: hypothetical protein DDT21_00865 [Syntrophomonadaceae bacterium]|nr:hypothetical protein [Bacillota bacterium]